MILSCSECGTRYLVPTQALGEAGRRVRCKVCNHEWFQSPEGDTSSSSGAESLATEDQPFEESYGPADDSPRFQEVLESIPEAIRPLPEGSELPALPGNIRPKQSRMAMVGYAAALILFIGSLAGIWLAHESIRNAWPESGVLLDFMIAPASGSASHQS